MVYEGSSKTYDFRKFKTILVFGNETILKWQRMNKNSCQSILENLKAKKKHKIPTEKKQKKMY